jgi:maleate isomerase
VLALNEILERTGVRRFALVTPYLDDVQAAILRNYAAAGVECVAERHLGLRDKLLVCRGRCRAPASDGARRGHGRPAGDRRPLHQPARRTLVAELEAETGIPIHDSVATVVWKSLQLAGADTRRIRGWGRLFDLPTP